MPLKINRRAGSSVWQITGTVAGERIRESTGISDRALAEAYRSNREQDLYRSVVFGKKAVVTWEEAVFSYSQVNNPSPGTAKFLYRLTRHLGRVKLKDINQEVLDRAIAVVCKPDAKPSTKYRTVLIPVSAVLNHAARRQWCDRPFFEAVPGAAGSKRTRWLAPEEFEKLCEAADPHLKPLIIFLATTGARLGEALSLQWQDVSLKDGSALLRNVKARHGQVRDRTLHMPPAAIATLVALPERDGGVFRRKWGAEYLTTKHNNNTQISAPWERAAKAAGLGEDVSPHVLRHTWATWHYAMHLDIMRLKDEGGWSSLALVERYTKLAGKTVAPKARVIFGLSTGANLTQAGAA